MSGHSAATVLVRALAWGGLLAGVAWANLANILCAAEPVFAPEAEARPLGIVAFTEGPAWHIDGNVYFSDGVNNRIVRRDPDGVIQVYRTPSGKANGLLFDVAGRLVACEGANEGGNRRVTRTECDGTITVLADRYEGRRFNSPNDLAIDGRGRIYFTDPRYGDRGDIEQFDEAGRAIEGVYRIDPDGTVERIISHEVDRPNGIHASPDDRWLYVIDNNNSVPNGSRKIWRFDLTAEGRVVPESRKMLHDFKRGRGGDGMAVDVEGRIYVAAGLGVHNLPLETTDNAPGVYVFSPDGKPEGFIAVPEDMVTNCTFGGPELKTLYITAGHTLWSVPVGTPGYVPWLSPKR